MASSQAKFRDTTENLESAQTNRDQNQRKRGRVGHYSFTISAAARLQTTQATVRRRTLTLRKMDQSSVLCKVIYIINAFPGLNDARTYSAVPEPPTPVKCQEGAVL
ncbi:unnamed protein product [Nyctereutes procyonoides]|uniref:(raccoon dog) hypothetical protein n=1 Tax=Nyctereutes procyonoides TaxID=34880 RepID=A0A811YND7_NYCPR|nr:unnamed protein product [Nyctereutes procyonoides]